MVAYVAEIYVSILFSFLHATFLNIPIYRVQIPQGQGQGWNNKLNLPQRPVSNTQWGAAPVANGCVVSISRDLMHSLAIHHPLPPRCCAVHKCMLLVRNV